MTRNFVDLDDLHKMFTVAGIEHLYTPGDTVITVIRRTHVWTVSENHVIYWGDTFDVCETPCRYITRTTDAYDYIMEHVAQVL